MHSKYVIGMSSLQSLTPKLLNKILDHLSFDDISQLRGISKNLHQAARKRLNSAFLELGPQLITKYTQYLILLKTHNASCISGDAIFRGRFLRLLGTEHAILLALCRNYITNGRGTFAPGEILDLFIELQESSQGMEQEENKKLAKLVLLIDQYLDWFERFRITSEEEEPSWWYGTCIVDLLDSYLSSSYNLVATHEGPLVKLSGQYEVKGQSEMPPKISEPLGGPIGLEELLQVLKYVRKHVRWSNFTNSFRSESERAAELEEDTEEVTTTVDKQEGYQRSYKRNQLDYYNDCDESTESLIVMVNLQCDRSCGPARLRGGFEEMRDWRKEIELLKRDMKDREPCLERDLAAIVSKNDASISSFKSKLAQLRSVKESSRVDHDLSSKKPVHEKYVFNLEIKSIYPSSDGNFGEKYGETMLHLTHTPEHIFAAQTECCLY